jgi:hypothetical protein
MIGRRVPEKGCTCVGRLVWSTITVEESSSRSLRPPKSQARRTDPTHPTKGFRQIGGCPEPTLNAPYRLRDRYLERRWPLAYSSKRFRSVLRPRPNTPGTVQVRRRSEAEPCHKTRPVKISVVHHANSHKSLRNPR